MRVPQGCNFGTILCFVDKSHKTKTVICKGEKKSLCISRQNIDSTSFISLCAQTNDIHSTYYCSNELVSCIYKLFDCSNALYAQLALFENWYF